MGAWRKLGRKIRLLLRKLREERGITGLETAIILIAFVVVASVFAYTILSAGIFSSERGKETIYAGLEEARGTMEPRGSVIAFDNAAIYDSDGSAVAAQAGNAVTKISFVVTNAVAGLPVDLTPPYLYDESSGLSQSGLDHVTVISYCDQDQMINNMAWTLNWLGDNDGDYLLETNEKAEITVWLVNYVYNTDQSQWEYRLGSGTDDPFMDDQTKLLGPNKEFTIEVKPPRGAVLTIQRTTPATLDAVMDLS